MMQHSELLLVLSYITPLVLVAITLNKQNQKRVIYWLLLIALPIFYIGHYLAIKSQAGWPSNLPLPAEFELIAQYIVEPNKADNSPGQIYIWAKQAQQQIPRVYALPYSKDNHVKLNEASNKQANGKQQIGRTEPSTPGEKGQVNAQQQIEFSDKPSHRPPDKAPAQNK